MFCLCVAGIMAGVGGNLSSEAVPLHDEQMEYMEKVGHGIVVPAICFIGMGLNIFNFIVLFSPKLPESSYSYLAGLAIADFLSLFLFGINGIGRGYHKGDYGWSVFEAFVYFPCGLITTNASVLLTLTVSIERFIFLYKPLQAKRWCNRSRARIIMAALWAVCVVVNIPRFFVFKIDETGLGYTVFGKSTPYNVLSWVYFFVVSVATALMLIVFNILLIRGIHVTNARRRTMSVHSAMSQHQRQEENRLTRTLISVIFLFLVGEIPSAMLSRSVVVGILGQGSREILQTHWYRSAVLVATILVVLQHASNFIIYCVCNKRFWAAFKHKFCPCMAKLTHGMLDSYTNIALSTAGGQ
jgi:hypothetical protein